MAQRVPMVKQALLITEGSAGEGSRGPPDMKFHALLQSTMWVGHVSRGPYPLGALRSIRGAAVPPASVPPLATPLVKIL